MPIALSAANIDFSPRVVATTTVAATPAGAAETTIVSLAIPSGLVYASGIYVSAGFNSLTLAASTATMNLKLKRGSTQLIATGLIPVTASTIQLPTNIDFFDASPGDAPTYNLTITLASAGSAASTLTVFAFALAV